jgi:hypothetical protein
MIETNAITTAAPRPAFVIAALCWSAIATPGCCRRSIAQCRSASPWRDLPPPPVPERDGKAVARKLIPVGSSGAGIEASSNSLARPPHTALFERQLASRRSRECRRRLHEENVPNGQPWPVVRLSTGKAHKDDNDRLRIGELWKSDYRPQALPRAHPHLPHLAPSRPSCLPTPRPQVTGNTSRIKVEGSTGRASLSEVDLE